MTSAEQQLRELLQDALPHPDQVDFDRLVRRVSRRRRLRISGAVGALVAVTVAAIVVPLSLIGGGSSPADSNNAGRHVIRGGPVRSTMIINGDTFAPPPPYMHATLTAQQAFNVYRGSPLTIPSFVSYQLGILTSPPSITDVLVWGFSGRTSNCVSFNGLGTPPPGSSPTHRCIPWDFVSATTGRGVESTAQDIGAPAPAPSPTPSAVIALRSGGFLDAEPQRYSPQDLVLQGPESTIRWSFDNSTCSIQLHWFLPPATQSSQDRAPCPWAHTFTTSVTAVFASRGHVFTVVAGYVPQLEHYLVKATLADGDTQIYDAADADAAWMIAVQRCGNIAGTAIKSVSEIRFRHGVIQTLALPTPPLGNAAIQRSCRSS